MIRIHFIIRNKLFYIFFFFTFLHFILFLLIVSLLEKKSNIALEHNSSHPCETA